MTGREAAKFALVLAMRDALRERRKGSPIAFQSVTRPPKTRRAG